MKGEVLMANDIFVIVTTIILAIPLTYTNILVFKNKFKDSYMHILFTDFVFIIYIIAFVVAVGQVFSHLIL